AAVAAGEALVGTLAPAERVTFAPAEGANVMGEDATIAPPARVRTSAPPPGAAGASLLQGAIVGTLEYMAPEQARGEAVDQRADIYAFGLILSDMLLGRRIVAEGTTPVDALQQRIQRPPVSLRET